MNKRTLHLDEWWPVLRLSKPDDASPEPVAEFSDGELTDIRRVQNEFRAWQSKIAARFGCGSLGWDHEIEETESERSAVEDGET